MEAVRLLQDAIRLQQELCDTPFGKELTLEASPVLWYGRPVPNQWLTIGTNPSRGECLHREGILRTGQIQKFYWRETLSFGDYLGNEEALLNGMRQSFYDYPAAVIYVDFFKFATYEQMGKMRRGRDWMEHPTSIELLERTITTINPIRLIVLGRDNCRAFGGFSTIGRLSAYPAVSYEIGRRESGIPMIVLHMKPSEVFVGLGNDCDSNELHYGSYAKRERLLRIGRTLDTIMDEWLADGRA